MSPRGSRIQGLAAGLPARADRVLARLDPREWVITHRHADIYVPMAFFAAGTVAFAFSAVPTLNIVIGLPPLAFILLVMIRAHRANTARRKEAMGEINDAHYLVRQYEYCLKLLKHFPDGWRTRLILNRLSSGIRLLVTRYRRYLNEDAVGAAIKAERLVLDAEIAEDDEIGDRVPAIAHQLGIVKSGIRDVNDPDVSGELGRI